MKTGVALLLRGSPADLSATLHAIELAKRTTGIVHAVFMEQGGKHKGKDPGRETENDTQPLAGQFIALANWLGDVAEVTVHIHRLESMADDLLVRFLCNYRIFYLILGAEDRSSLKRKTAWIARLRRRLDEQDDCFLPQLWSVIIQPWNDLVFARIIAGFKRAAWSTSAIEILISSLQNGLKESSTEKESKKKSLKGGKNVHVPSDSPHQR
ncbi:MAG: hypothetical protein Q7U64_01495 [Desulfocapsaceae bacterium]|nr:hypothetical protein [Desulfocapsaceae bacterium]